MKIIPGSRVHTPFRQTTVDMFQVQIQDFPFTITQLQKKG